MDSKSGLNITDSDNDMPAAPQPGESFEPTETPPASTASDAPSPGVDADVETSPETTFDQPAAPEPPASTEPEPSTVESDPSPLDTDEFGSIDAAMAETQSDTDDPNVSSDMGSDAVDSETSEFSNPLDTADSGDTIPVTVGSSQDNMSGPEMPESPELGGMGAADESLGAMSAAAPAAAAMSSESFRGAAPAPSPEAGPVNVTVQHQQAAAPAAKPQRTPEWFAGPPAATNQPMTSSPMQPEHQMMPPQGMPPVIPHQGKKSSKKGLLIAIILVLLMAGGAAAYFLVGPGKQDANVAQTTEQTSTETPVEDMPAEEEKQPEAITASYLSEFDAVCEGKTISNAADFTTNQTAIITTFSNNPRNAERWSSEIFGSGKSYYLDDVDQFAKVSVVGCVKADESTIVDGLKCEYTSSSTGKVSVDYKALKYELTLYEAKTGKKIGESTIIDAPADTCPTVLLYDAETKTAYASPDEDALEVALDTFVK